MANYRLFCCVVIIIALFVSSKGQVADHLHQYRFYDRHQRDRYPRCEHVRSIDEIDAIKICKGAKINEPHYADEYRDACRMFGRKALHIELNPGDIQNLINRDHYRTTSGVLGHHTYRPLCGHMLDYGDLRMGKHICGTIPLPHRIDAKCVTECSM